MNHKTFDNFYNRRPTIVMITPYSPINDRLILFYGGGDYVMCCSTANLYQNLYSAMVSKNMIIASPTM